MKRAIIFTSSNGIKEAYTEGDILLLRPCSLEEWNKRTPIANDYNCRNHETFLARRDSYFGNKYILGRVAYVNTNYQNQINGKIDFIHINDNCCWSNCYPLGRGRSYLDMNHFDVIRVVSAVKTDNYRDALRFVKNNKTICDIPKSRIVTSATEDRWSNLPGYRCDNIIGRVNHRRMIRMQAEQQLTSTQNVN